MKLYHKIYLTLRLQEIGTKTNQKLVLWDARENDGEINNYKVRNELQRVPALMRVCARIVFNLYLRLSSRHVQSFTRCTKFRCTVLCQFYGTRRGYGAIRYRARLCSAILLHLLYANRLLY